jgi:NarL family two-component system sensor histidine kinase LiaS
MKQAENDLQQRLLEIERLNQELQESQAQVVDQQRSIATIAERQRLARDMHDSVNQSIHSLMLFSETLVALLQKNRAQEALETAERIQESGQRALKEIRLMLYRAQSVLINENTNLVDALEERLNMVERRVGITAKVIGADEIRKHCPAAWADNLYWIIMEALNNSLKHAQAQSVKIFFKYDSKHIEAEIADDGAGFDPEQIRAGGYGMKSMRERVDLLGGYLTITSAPGCGTRVRIKIEMEN